MINKLLFFKIFLMLILTSCSEYRKILKSTGYQKKLDAAMEYYEEEKYFKASTLFKDIKPLVKGSEESEIVDFYFAYSLYNLEQYETSAKYFKSFIMTSSHKSLSFRSFIRSLKRILYPSI